MFSVTDDEFDEMMAAAIDSIPDRFTAELENLVFFWDFEPNPDDFEPDEFDPDLLGCYDGVDLYDRGDSYGAVPDFPDSITVYKGPHERMCASREELAEEVRRTVVHEVGHYFGMDEAAIERMGYR